MIRTLSFTFAALAVAAPAQLTSQIATLTDYGALATAGRAVAFQSVDAHTVVTRGLLVAARLGSTREEHFVATTQVTPDSPSADVAGVRVTETGSATSTNAGTAASVGTSPSHQSSTTPVFGPHAVTLHVALRQGAHARVVVAWGGTATAAASARTAVDVDGDRHPDFVARAGGRVQQEFHVTASATGVTVSIETEARATLAGAGQEGYAASLSVHVSVDGGGGGCTVTPFGPECGGRLAGTAVAGSRDITLALAVSHAAPNAIGILAIGDRLATPIPLPGSPHHCDLLVAPRLTALIPIDGSGAGRAAVRLPGHPLDIDLQVVTLAVGTSIELASTNGLNVVCR